MRTRSAVVDVLGARRKFYRAVISGQIVPPETCEHCGKIPGKSKDGARMIQGHHHKGYENEFIYDVEWLCPSCHKLAHPTAWTDSAKAKLSKTISGRRLELTENQRENRSKKCAAQKPWLAWQAKCGNSCKNNHKANWGQDNRGSRFCRTCANERRRKVS